MLVEDAALRQAPLSRSTIEKMVLDTQKKYNLSDRFYGTMQCESMGFQNIQSKVPKKNGPNGREDSWGVPQIHLPAHPNITRTQAMDVRFAIDWAGKQFALGRERMWSCYTLKYGDGKV